MIFDAFQRKHRATRYNSVVDFQKKSYTNFQETSRKKRVYQKFSHKGTVLSQEITQRLGITELEP